MPDGHARPPDLIVKVSDAKARLSELIARAERGERVVIARGDTLAVTLVPVERPKRRLGGTRDRFTKEQLAVLDQQIDELERNGWYTEEELDEFEGDLEDELTRA